MAALYFAPWGLGLLALVPEEPLSGQLWRLISYPLVHLSFAHLMWDASAFLLLGAIAESEGRLRYGILLVTAALLPALALRAATGGSVGLAGSSGLDSALFAYISTGLLVKAEAKPPLRIAGGLLLFAISLKVAVEWATKGAVFAHLPGPASPAPIHACAMLAGVTLALFFDEAPCCKGSQGGKITQ